MSSLAAFQDAFAAALRDGRPPHGYGDPAQLEPGMAVYRNTVFKGLLDALRANFPTVERLVGGEWFSAAAHAYLDVDWARGPSLMTFGEGFPDFLATFPPAEALSYLPGVARLDRFWIESHAAADAPVLAASALADLPPERLFELTLRLHPTARLGWFTEPAPTIWRLNRPPGPAPDEAQVDWRAEGALVARPWGEVVAVVLDAAGFAFLEACRRGEPLGGAATAALTADPQADLSRHIAAFIDFGAFEPLQPAIGRPGP